ncbi:MAG: RtcB family protein [Candidatus Aureabacteria bacterium]|nr:RtcB family protein [Candidatus Auribacterota bacterium]
MLRKIDDFRWEIPTSFQAGMRVPGIIYASEDLLRHIQKDQTFQQVANVATLPGIVKYSLAMPDIHWGYGFPIGGVAATDPSSGGVIAPGGIGYDICCGIRLMRTDVMKDEAVREMPRLLPALFHRVPSGVGSKSFIRLKGKDGDAVMAKGSLWAVRQGYGEEADLRRTEEGGCLAGADPACVSERAKQRGSAQVGTLGSGNHFLEVQYVDEIYDDPTARAFGLTPGLVTVMIHCGSRGLGHQVCDDYLKVMGGAVRRYGITLPDRQLACAPVESEEGKEYFAAMACAANYAWGNRQVIMHLVREVFQKVFHRGPDDLKMNLVFDVAHNIAKFEEHGVDGKVRRLCVHRKGATRAFAPGHPSLPDEYRATGQPVIIPGDMGTCSYVLAGTERAMTETWGSTCHGAGREMSRHAALEATRGKDIVGELKGKGIMVMAESLKTLGEEAPLAYKDVSAVVDVVARAGISRKIARLRPIGVIKG